jgi:hypothetical protein
MFTALANQMFGKGSLRGEKAVRGTTFWSNFSIGAAIRIFLRVCQFFMGIAVIALYAQDLDRARRAGKYTDSKWVWAVVCGTLSALTSALFVTPWLKAWFFFAADAFIFICYLVAFGIFGKMYIPENPEGNSGITRMKNGVWVLLTNMLLWLITAVYGAVVFWKSRKASTSFTGRGSVHV